MKNRNIKYLFFLFLLFIPVLFFIVFFSSYIFIDKNTPSEENTRDYHIVIVGRSENLSFLNQVYEGASQAAPMYNAVVELYAPSSKAEDTNLSSLIEYAGFINADGIIAYVDPDTPPFEQPRRLDDKEIPIVTLGHFNPYMPQISFMGNNYSEVGRELAAQTVESVGKTGRIIITGFDGNNSLTYSTLMNSFQLYLRQNSSLEFLVVNSEIIHNEIELNRLLRQEDNPIDAVVCLTEEETITVAQAATALKDQRNIKIICFGENETIKLYLEKAIVTKIIAVDPIRTGSQAMKELFEYINNDYANSYVNAPLIIKNVPVNGSIRAQSYTNLQGGRP